MAKRLATRAELLDRWRGIEEEEEEDDVDDRIDPSKHRSLHQSKEQWFADAFNYLISLPKENHIWCGSWDLMGPLLETFYNYFKDERGDSPLRRLWKRISEEMQQCVQCITQHHQAQEMYSMEYELSSISPLLDVLRSLDEERVTTHLKEINSRLVREDYDPAHNNFEVVSVMYEVLMFPVMLDDQSLFTEFEQFIEAIDNIHELALDGQQQFPGVYALFFFKRRVRSVGHRLAGSMGKLRRATDLEPLQPLIKKFIGFLETEALPSAMKTSRPRAELDRVSIWLGIKSLLGFLEPPAFEEGILERYPIILDIVLNHISGDSLDFSHAVTCLRLLFEMLGCKLWLRSTLSPSVMRNTLLGQCFHTRNEKSHKDIFDLFQPFLQSLEALQDGEHEKQRRHFLYFLLHQVPVSSNFSFLTRQKARQIALLIVRRGYAMNPPCPPFECAHMWGPPLVSSLKDSSLHNSLRQPAFDLIQTILVSDAAVLISSLLSSCPPPSPGRSISNELNDDEDDVRLLFAVDAEEKNDSSWRDFGMQSKIASLDFGEWMCIPMLWIDVLVDINPLVLPVSFWKAVFWARSRFSMVEPETNSEMTIPVRTWLSSSEISSTFGWKLPTGSDDGGDEKEQKNSIKVSTMSLALIQAFTRLTAHFLVQVGQAELRKQWTWEPRMGESLILSLLDPSDTVRQFGKCILEHVSDTRGLACGLKFLCSSGSSLSSVVLGFRHAVKLVQVNIVVLKFQMLQHFFFILRKLVEQGELPTPDMPEKSSDFASISKFSTHGGFLRQPVFDSLTVSMDGKSVEINKKLQEKFCCLLSETAWPCIRRCLIEGKASIDSSICQMTCIRLLEILPIVFEKLWPSFVKQPDSCGILKSAFDFSWLHDLVDWGKSALKVVVVYWKRAIGSLLKLLKGSCHKTVALTIKTIEDLISCDSVSMDGLTEQVSHLSVSLSKEASDNIKRNFSSESLPLKMKEPILEVQPWPIKDSEVQILDPATINDKKDGNDLIVLSDDEKEVLPSEIMLSDSSIGRCKLDSKTVASRVDENTSNIELTSKKVYGVDTSKDILKATLSVDVTDGLASKLNSDKPSKKLESITFPKSGVDNNQKERISERDTIVSLKSQGRVDLKKSSDVAVGYKKSNKTCESLKTNDMVLKDIVCDAEDDPLESALNSVRRQSSPLAKPNIFVPKRQLIQLRTPVGDKSGNFQRLEARVRRFKPPRLDEWYKPILEIDYFATTGLSSACEDNRCTFGKLKEVPVSFESPEEYIDIFRPLVLEEFKAQLQSSFQENPSWEEMYFGVVSVLAVERVDDFHLVRFAHDDDDSTSSRSFSENDLVLLTKEPLQKSSHDVHMVGKVERRERDNKRRLSILLIRFYLQNGTSRLNQARKNLLERSKWHASRIMSITPQLREFQALSSIKEIPLFPIILKPINDGPCSKDFSKVDLSKLSQPLQLILKSSFNESQLQAISVAIGLRSSKKKVELSLIQGPPGTGKTRTILAIASGLLACPSEKTDKTENPLAGTGSLKKSNSLLTKIRETAAIARAWQDAALAKQLNEDVQRTSKSTDATVKRRVLICAQSNAAVDELVSRISSQGLYRIDGKMYKPYLVRVGNVKTVHPNSLPFFIDTLVDHRLADETMKLSESKNDMNVHSSTTLRSNLEKLVDRIRFYEAKRANLSDENSNLKNSLEDDSHKEDDLKELSDAKVQMKLRKLYEQKKQIYKDLSIAQAQEKKTNEEIKGLKYKIRKSILREAEIVVTTLSGCGGDLYAVCSESVSGHRFGSPSENTLFDAVVIDEAAQALEPATLIPLQLLKSNGVKCIMVGDPKQLPATVLSNVASKFLFECSMFERLQKAGHPVVMLTKQYRMHPEICRFPSSHFYERKLLNGEMSSKLAPFHETEGLGPYVFYDIIDGRELRGKNSGALSLYNEHEVDAALEVVKFFKNKYPSEFIAGRIGIITPYKRQLSLLRSRFSTFFGSSIVDDMEFNTVDGFQGREVDILILSTVRAATSSAGPGINLSNIGFVADVRRMNVALTRAKLSLWVVGNARTLQTNKNWAALIKDAVERNLVRTVKMPYRSMFKGSLQKNRASENLMELKCDEKVKDASQHVKQNESSKRIGKIRTNYINQGAKSRDDGREKDSSATRDDVGINKRSFRDGLLPVDSSSVVVANVDSKFSEDGKFVTRGKHVTYGEFKGKESGGKFVTRDDGRENDSSATRDDVGINKRSGRDGLLPVDSSSVVVENVDSKFSEDGKFVTRGKHVTYGEFKGKESDGKKIKENSQKVKRKSKLENSGKSMYHPEEDTGDKGLKEQMPKRLKTFSGGDGRRQGNQDASAPSAATASSHNGRDLNDQGRDPNKVGTSDLIAKRKKQREAVDAILYSALIPSKKSETSAKPLPAKRHSSSSSTPSIGIKQPKTRRD